VIARGIARGEFRDVHIDHAVHGVVSTMIYLALSKHTVCLCTKDGAPLDPIAYLQEQADIVARGLSAAPVADDGPRPGARA
jgi:hypothetical protein